MTIIFPPQLSLDLHNGTPPIATDPIVEQLLANGAAAALNVSGGKDSFACAIAANAHLNLISHTGPRLLVHSDLGLIEWKDSLPASQRLADHLGLPLLVTRRKAGGMIERWQQRWTDNQARWADLQTATLTLPWSTPTMRFCNSELKAAPIASLLRREFKQIPIISITGIRAQESSNRAKKTPAKYEERLSRKSLPGYSWNPILYWKLSDVLTCINHSGLTLHEAYTTYGSSRVSCTYCIMSAIADLKAATTCADNYAPYREIVNLESLSAFQFQSSLWLSDIAPHLLSVEQLTRAHEAKNVAEVRRTLEGHMPPAAFFEKGKIPQIPPLSDATTIAAIRTGIAALYAIKTPYTSPSAIRDRYAERAADFLAAA